MPSLLLRLEADAEITRGESEENAYRVANLEQEKEALEVSLAESRKKVTEIREDAAKAAKASARLQQARERVGARERRTKRDASATKTYYYICSNETVNGTDGLRRALFEVETLRRQLGGRRQK